MNAERRTFLGARLNGDLKSQSVTYFLLVLTLTSIYFAEEKPLVGHFRFVEGRKK